MTQSLGLTPLAEGVESEEQLAALIEMGCARAQGFLLGKPVFAEEFVTAWLAGPASS